MLAVVAEVHILDPYLVHNPVLVDPVVVVQVVLIQILTVLTVLQILEVVVEPAHASLEL
jgi:hypothetical protein